MEDIMAKKVTAKKSVASADDAPEAKRSTKDQQEAAEALFVGADGAHRTEEQHENHVRRQVLGY
jgi:hypothetical protein